jgi:Tfp pilus assembly protein PilW
MRRRRPSAGLTLIELMIAVFLTALVAVIAGVIYLANQRSWDQGKDKLIMQQEATRCVETVARDVRAARWIDFVDATEIRVYDRTGTEFRHYELGATAGGNRVLQNGSPLVDLLCTELTFTTNADTTVLGIALELEDGAENRVKVESRAAVRNRNFSNL